MRASASRWRYAGALALPLAWFAPALARAQAIERNLPPQMAHGSSVIVTPVGTPFETQA